MTCPCPTALSRRVRPSERQRIPAAGRIRVWLALDLPRLARGRHVVHDAIVLVLRQGMLEPV